jgi:ribonuclease P protein component
VIIGRIQRSADFERVLGTPPSARTAHFAVHHVATVPSVPLKPAALRRKLELSTGKATEVTAAVDDQAPAPSNAPPADPQQVWLGCVVPKRNARRSVTRTLLKRQIREAAKRHGVNLRAGLWVVRLRSPFDKKQFVSAASDALRTAARDELDALFGSAVRRMARAATPAVAA